MGLYDNLKEILGLVKGVASSDVTVKLNDALSQATDLLDSVRTLKEENFDLKQQLKLKDDIVEEEGYITRKSNGNKDIKYCPTCWGEKNKLVPFVGNHRGFYQCQLCKTSYSTPRYENYAPKMNSYSTDPFEPY